MRFAAAISILIALVLTACSGGGAEPTTTIAGPGTTTTTIAAPGTTTSTEPTSTVAPTTTVPQSVGTVFGYLRSFEHTGDGLVVVLVDEAQMLSGEEALEAAREDGVVGEDEDLPNDFYIRNLDETTVAHTVSSDAEILLQGVLPGASPALEAVDLDTWSALLGGEEDPDLDWTWYGAGSSPYWFEVADGEIVRVEEQYLP